MLTCLSFRSTFYFPWFLLYSEANIRLFLSFDCLRHIAAKSDTVFLNLQPSCAKCWIAKHLKSRCVFQAPRFSLSLLNSVNSSSLLLLNQSSMWLLTLVFSFNILETEKKLGVWKKQNKNRQYFQSFSKQLVVIRSARPRQFNVFAPLFSRAKWRFLLFLYTVYFFEKTLNYIFQGTNPKTLVTLHI